MELEHVDEIQLRPGVLLVELEGVAPGLEAHADLDRVERACRTRVLDGRLRTVGTREAVRPLVVVEAAADRYFFDRTADLPAVSAVHDDVRIAIHARSRFG